MEIPAHIFRAYDIRGLLSEVTPEVAVAASQALIRKTGAKTVVVGRDMRETSEGLQQAVMETLVNCGVRVIDIGLCSTSLFNFAVSSDEMVSAGIMVTASHNPPEFNGLKAAHASGLPISGVELLEEITHPSTSTPVGRGEMVQKDLLSLYVDHCVKGVDPALFTGSRVAIDYGNGMGAMTIRLIAKRLGVELVELYATPDAHFPHHEANPVKEETLTELKALVLREGADFGVALDGDADRIGFVDEEGVSVRGDLMLGVYAKEALQRIGPAKIVCAPNQSWATFAAVVQNGGDIIECRIGRKFAIEAVKKEGAVVGGEVSGHFFFQETQGLESVDYAFVRALLAWKEAGASFSSLVRPLRAFANSGEVNIEVHDKAVILDRLETYVETATRVNRLDGVRAEFGDEWWFIVRPSNTEPLLRLIVEAKSESLMQEKCAELSRFIQES